MFMPRLVRGDAGLRLTAFNSGNRSAGDLEEKQLHEYGDY